MDQVLDALEKCQNWKQLMRSSCKQNHLNTLMAVDLTILKLRNFNEKFKKSIISLGSKIKTFWVENQLKAFNWILIAVSGLQRIKIEDFGQNQWRIMHKIFYGKELLFLKFQAKRLIEKKKKKSKKWEIEQEQLLYKYVNQTSRESRKAWNQIALKMFQASNGTIFREGKHCREHWLNYLDPTKTRGKWTIQQDIVLIQSVNEGGKKWSQYALELKRTEHSVKNRYNSLLTKQQKLTPTIKKQNRLIEQILFRLKSGDGVRQQSQSSQQMIEQQQQDYRQQQFCQQKIKSPSPEENQIKQIVKTQIFNQYKSEHNQDIQQKCIEKKPETQKNLENYSNSSNLCASYDFGIIIRQDNQKNNYSEYPIISPFIYSPSPTSYLNSPVFMIKQPNGFSTFQYLYSTWVNCSNPMEPIQKTQQQKNNDNI